MAAVTHLYLSHPQVAIDPDVPVPQWGLSPKGRDRALSFAARPWLAPFRRIVASEETKAIETAEILGEAMAISVEIRDGMHENDRSATGFLPPPEFSATADAFFAAPQISIRGWERAVDAQERIVAAVSAALAENPTIPTIFVGHGGVGTLLHCHCGGLPIARSYDQIDGGGCHYGFSLDPRIVLYHWRLMEAEPDPAL